MRTLRRANFFNTIRATARHVALTKALLPHGRRVLLFADFPSQLNSRIFADHIEASLLTQQSFQSSRSIDRCYVSTDDRRVFVQA